MLPSLCNNFSENLNWCSAHINIKKKVAGDNGVAGKKEAAAEKKAPEKVPEEKDKEVSVSLLKIQVGLIRKAWKHPSADRYISF